MEYQVGGKKHHRHGVYSEGSWLSWIMKNRFVLIIVFVLFVIIVVPWLVCDVLGLSLICDIINGIYNLIKEVFGIFS